MSPILARASPVPALGLPAVFLGVPVALSYIASGGIALTLAFLALLEASLATKALMIEAVKRMQFRSLQKLRAAMPNKLEDIVQIRVPGRENVFPAEQ
jgi:hypothetical protein